MNKLIFFATFAVLISGCSYFDDKKDQASNQQMPPLPVGVVEAKMGDIPITLTYNGQTSSDLDVILKAQVRGTLEKQHFKPGQFVKQGDVLYEIEPDKYKAVYDSAKATLNNATAEFKRAQNLKHANAISQKEYDAANAAYNIAQANLTSAKIDLDYSIIKAPFSGMIGDTKKDVGSYVREDSDLVRLSKLDPIYVKFGIADVDKLELDNKLSSKEWIQLNSLVTINLNGKDHNGTLTYIDNIIDEDTATVDAKASFENPNLDIRPGTYTKVSVEGFYQKNGFKIPQIAVLQDLSNPYVYVIENGKIAKKIVKIVSQNATTAVISDGLKDKDLVVVDNFKKIRVGQDVMPVPANATPQEVQAKMQEMAKQAAQKEGKK